MTEEENNEKRDDKFGFLKAFNRAGYFFGLGIQLAVTVVLMFFLGSWLDEKWGTTPWMMLLGILFGASAGLYSFIKTVYSLEKKKNEN